MKIFKTTYDSVAECIYMYVSENKITKTIQASDTVNIDVDIEGNIVGIEMMDVSPKAMKSMFLPNLVVLA